MRVRGHAKGNSDASTRRKNLVLAGKACIWVPYRNGADEALKAAGLLEVLMNVVKSGNAADNSTTD